MSFYVRRMQVACSTAFWARVMGLLSSYKQTTVGFALKLHHRFVRHHRLSAVLPLLNHLGVSIQRCCLNLKYLFIQRLGPVQESTSLVKVQMLFLAICTILHTLEVGWNWKTENQKPRCETTSCHQLLIWHTCTRIPTQQTTWGYGYVISALHTYCLVNITQWSDALPE